MSGVTESVVEHAAVAWLEAIDWQVAHGPDFARNAPGSVMPIVGSFE